ncbi:MAG: SusD/RagB family nutrient-binding outer rane lipoprotein [Bacteroidetes bacterium]|nr:SusD/RagB family nutrient-binding outer rane lipoprotein [Bacteroidota bacterium]
MKKIIYKFLMATSCAVLMYSCADLTSVNENPNEASSVPSNMIFSGAQKKMMDYVYDNWFSGRQCIVYSQYWGQRNYTEEDRYQIRESVNNNYFNYFYTTMTNMDKVIAMNEDESTKTVSAAYGNNSNQIAAAMIMKVWLYSVMSDTWGDIPYSQAGKLEDGIYYPVYDDHETIYESLISKLDSAVSIINEDEVAFTGGDMIYGGDASKWKKFANSLKCRLAIHMSKVNSNWKTYIAEAVSSGVFTSNDDNAAYHYSLTSPDYCLFYSGFYISARNDFSITRNFMDVLKGQPDTLNSKSHPWEGVVDPRFEIYTGVSATSSYIGIPYGVPSGQMTSAFRSLAPNLYSLKPLVLHADFAVPIMSYAELKFILSEYNGFDESDYQEGVEASVEYWFDLASSSISDADLATYVSSVSTTVNAETVALQKYIDLYMNGTEAWVEYRRTGYPNQLIKPGDNITYNASGTLITFTPLSTVNGDIIARVKYPTNESTLNGTSFAAAVAKLDDGTNNYYTKMFWDVRTTADPHPANK